MGVFGESRSRGFPGRDGRTCVAGGRAERITFRGWGLMDGAGPEEKDRREEQRHQEDIELWFHIDVTRSGFITPLDPDALPGA